MSRMMKSRMLVRGVMMFTSLSSRLVRFFFFFFFLSLFGGQGVGGKES